MEENQIGVTETSDSNTQTTSPVDQTNTNPVQEAETIQSNVVQEAKPEQNIPYARFKEINDELKALKAEKLANSTQNKTPDSSLKQQNPQDTAKEGAEIAHPFADHPILQNISIPQFREPKVDTETGEVIDPGYESIGALGNDILKAIGDNLPLMMQNALKQQEQAAEAKQTEYTNDLNDLQSTWNDQAKFDSFLNYYKDAFEAAQSEGLELKANVAAKLFEKSYKPVVKTNAANKEVAAKIATPNTQSSSNSTGSIRDKSYADILRES